MINVNEVRVQGVCRKVSIDRTFQGVVMEIVAIPGVTNASEPVPFLPRGQYVQTGQKEAQTQMLFFMTSLLSSTLRKKSGFTQSQRSTRHQSNESQSIFTAPTHQAKVEVSSVVIDRSRKAAGRSITDIVFHFRTQKSELLHSPFGFFVKGIEF